MKVSVCLATYNGERYIREQMDSILNQKFLEHPEVDMEIIVSDDMSTDRTIEIIESYRDSRIQIYRHEQKRRYRFYHALRCATANFAHALHYATGDYIFLSDQDDVWYPQKIDKSLTELRKFGSGVVAVSMDVIDLNGKKLGAHIFRDKTFWQMYRHFELYGFTMAMTRDMLDALLPMPPVAQHDYFIGLYAKRHGNLTLIQEPLAAHRWGGGNTSYSGYGTPLTVKVWNRVKLLWYTLIR